MEGFYTIYWFYMSHRGFDTVATNTIYSAYSIAQVCCWRAVGYEWKISFGLRRSAPPPSGVGTLLGSLLIIVNPGSFLLLIQQGCVEAILLRILVHLAPEVLLLAAGLASISGAVREQCSKHRTVPRSTIP
jgi:hypothetical protein